MVYQRCCRNDEIANLPTSNRAGSTDFYGNTYQIEIPSFNAVGCNSSPDFIEEPPIALCFGIDVSTTGLNLSAIDTLDNDSLVYFLCAPLDFNQDELPFTRPVGQPNAAPDTANFPPYNFVPFITGRSADDPIPSNPKIKMDSATGEISGIPTINDKKYVIGICVEEYRRGTGILLSTTRRDIQISTANCNPNIVSAVQEQQQFCDGFEVQFRNNSTSTSGNIVSYKWDFGVAGIDSDTSREEEPIFTFPAEGAYSITLTANPDLPCSDDTTVLFEVLPLLEPEMELTGQFCRDNNLIDFAAAGDYESDATFLWNFGPLATRQTGTQEIENDIVFISTATDIRISLTVSQGYML